MKHFLTVIALLFVVFVSAQEEKEKPQFEWDAIIRLTFVKPIAFGNNALSEAHREKSGFDINWSLFKYNKFRLGIGYDFEQFAVTDRTVIGNIERSNYTSLYGYFSYDWQVEKKVILYPNMGYGKVKLQQWGNGSVSYGHQDGSEIRLGIIGTYALTPGTSVVLSAHYLHAFLDVNTSPEFESYFGTANQIQIGIGFQFK